MSEKKNNPVIRIMQLVALEKKEITAVYFYAILNGLIQLSLPLGIQAIVGFVLGASMRASLVVLIVLVVAGVLAAGMMQVNQMKIIEKIQQKLFVRYSLAFADHIPKLDLKKTNSYYLPELVNRFFDVPVLQKSLSKLLLDIPTASIQILFGLILLSFYHPAFILFGIVLVFLLWLILYYTGQRGLETSLEKSTYKYKVAAWLEESARVIKSTKLAKANNLHLEKTDDLVSGYLSARNRHFGILLLQYNVLVIFKTIVTAAMLIVGTFLLVNMQINIGQFIAAEIVILLVLNSVEKLIMNLNSVYDTLTAVEKLANLTDKPIETEGTLELPPGEQGLKLEMKNLSFSYTDETDILKNISLRIGPGEKVCITGKDGSGKSTLLRVMAGAYSDFRGSCLVNDVPMNNYTRDSLRQRTGVLLNDQDIFQGTLWENITLGNDDIETSDVIDLLSKAGLQSFYASLPNGFDTILDPTGKRLPKTVVHKILLVRALVGSPSLLLLEDPWMGVDEEHREQIIRLLLNNRNVTVVVVSNDAGFARMCGQVIRIENGSTSTIVNDSKNNSNETV
ncbi:MAG TPA: ATP-binding cassette domain-containing protein [Ferruginibacter sp.]|jgi:ABC-type bacteriocin/lantibiotic exporter with double-glycine peptidase domain|nr:ATP-binding cassette domain-containing protein [Chitinophagales bacterium]HMW25520.1 ATP-binding cassette domain-containing protein [Ferruginibacter sp.]HNJ94137.1 ATP-binding cassette domain-containing protein [Ferruginibacter sp.]HNN70083.1 ATP-binding cassette domain-containing protein [Ferruginibacter sp.]